MSKVELMPSLFIGHGSPMNVIEDNKYTQGWEKIAKEIPTPQAILCISAHWFIPDTRVGEMESPRTIHDFYGFPQVLYEQQYPAPGAPEVAKDVQGLVHSVEVKLDSSWGLDHGTWSVLSKMYPDATIPTTQLSIDYTKKPGEHYKIAQQLHSLRNNGVLIIGSGNLVHNLGMARLDMGELVYDWTPEFDQKMVDSLLNGDHEPIINYTELSDLARLAHPTPDHFLPLLYTIGAADTSEDVSVFNQYYFAGSLSMTSFKIG
ncbi:MAG: 4,5-DOPA dioxygenase extradiol [Candidatus Thorarchaeota archaeon]